jgi:hypothetical protein
MNHPTLCINDHYFYVYLITLIYCYLLVLDDLWGFSYKVPFICVLTLHAEKACFRIFHFQRPSRSQKGLGFLPRRFFGEILLEICPRGNNKVVIIIFHVRDKCLLAML